MSQFVRLAETDRPAISFRLDGAEVSALGGDTVLTAILTLHRHVRRSEFDGGPRAAFCIMGACQDCWVWLRDGTRLRACTTFVEPGIDLLTAPPPLPASWPLPEAGP
jgi:D-hydroxyproline dehydrogenase subunit gamma